MIVALIILTLLRGDKQIAHVKNCSNVDWILVAILVLVGIILAIIGIFIVKNEIKEKVRVGYEFSSTDI